MHRCQERSSWRRTYCPALGTRSLVPVDTVETASQEVTLRCTRTEFDHFEHAEEFQFLPGPTGEMGYGSDQMLLWLYYGLDGLAGFGGNGVQPILHDKVPVGEVEVRPGEQVHATDGNIGRVQGLVIDPNDHHVTHVLLQEGHLWGASRSPFRSRRSRPSTTGSG